MLGVLIRMGELGAPVTALYWSRDDMGHRDPMIVEAMTQDQFRDAWAMLSFREPGSTEFDGNPWAKIWWVVQEVNSAFQAGYIPTQDVVVDEMMVSCHSRQGRATQQRMDRKPNFKCGFKFWGLALSNRYLYKFVPYIAERVGGAAFDSAKGYVRTLIEDWLLTPDFDNKNHVLVCDAYFTTIPGFKALCQRGIWAVGMFNGQRAKNGGADSWPHREYKKTGLDARLFGRGWYRTSYQRLGAGAALLAMTWRDNKFVKIISTTFHEKVETTVKRWIGAARGRVEVPTRALLKAYQGKMGKVDGFDRLLALLNIGLPRCQLRYHRRIFEFLLAAIVANVIIVFAETKMGRWWMKKKKKTSKGPVRCTQSQLASTLIKAGKEWDRKEAMKQMEEEARLQAVKIVAKEAAAAAAAKQAAKTAKKKRGRSSTKAPAARAPRARKAKENADSVQRSGVGGNERRRSRAGANPLSSGRKQERRKSSRRSSVEEVKEELFAEKAAGYESLLERRKGRAQVKKTECRVGTKNHLWVQIFTGKKRARCAQCKQRAVADPNALPGREHERTHLKLPNGRTRSIPTTNHGCLHCDPAKPVPLCVDCFVPYHNAQKGWLPSLSLR